MTGSSLLSLSSSLLSRSPPPPPPEPSASCAPSLPLHPPWCSIFWHRVSPHHLCCLCWSAFGAGVWTLVVVVVQLAELALTRWLDLLPSLSRLPSLPFFCSCTASSCSLLLDDHTRSVRTLPRVDVLRACVCVCIYVRASRRRRHRILEFITPGTRRRAVSPAPPPPYPLVLAG